ncbi:pollen-specific leucine-rich repeat extensin-like protein 2 [Cimex lectularius]|uniref:DUF243 domain-containing protein n=1 Tax=Cimex lectularius TaxID=79782 RepID=A0A8I6RKY4_CIMLE|nr:pollen-specific leucine-rich repeat extensin-like protein 2 [Cimex lectularius]
MKFLVVVAAFLSSVLAAPDGYHYDNPHGEPLVQKHIYVHVPPPDPEFHAPPQRLVPAPPPKKHYKIVFIKAPTYAPPQVPVIPELQQHQEKTLIYVLHKNPSEAPPIVIPTAKPTQPSKPEVFFIRYKTQKEVGYAGGHEGQEGEHSGGYLPSSTAGYVSSTLAPHYVSSTPRPYIRASRTPTPKYKQSKESSHGSEEQDYSPSSTASYVSSTVAPKYIHTIRPYVRPVRTPMPKYITPKTPVVSQETANSEEDAESNESQE